MSPYTHGHAHMAWLDGLPAEWRALVNEYNSVNGVKFAIRRGLTPEQARAQLEAQRAKRQWEPVDGKPKPPSAKMEARPGRLRRIVGDFKSWCAANVEPRRRRGTAVAVIGALAVSLGKAVAMVAR